MEGIEMPDNIYGKYFFRYEGKQDFILGNVLQKFDSTFMKGSNFYFLHWIMPDQSLLEREELKVGHPPHVHKHAEILFHIGTNPDDPLDLGAEIEFHMGKEMERHVITQTTAVFIPPMVVHAPWRPLKLRRPFIFLQVNQELEKTEKFFPGLLSEDLRKRADWNAWKDVGF
jgi:hypothetical protein